MATNPVPILVFGRSVISGLLRYGNSHQDASNDVLFFGRTAEAAFAGIGGKVSFDRLFVAITFTHPFRIRLTPITDGKINVGEYAEIQITQAEFDDVANDLTEGEKATHLFEVTLSEPYIRDSIERSRHALMGSYFQVEVEQMDPMPSDSELIVGGIEVEYQVLVQSQVA